MKRQKRYNSCWIACGSIMTLLFSLSIKFLSKLLGTPQDDINLTLINFYAILNIPKNLSCPLYLYHPLFWDFLYEQTRCGKFLGHKKQAHNRMRNTSTLTDTHIITWLCWLEGLRFLTNGLVRVQYLTKRLRWTTTFSWNFMTWLSILYTFKKQ